MKEIRDIAVELFGESHPCQCGGAHEICLNCHHCKVNLPDQKWNARHPVAEYLDSTILKADASAQEITDLGNYAVQTKCRAVCINSYYLHLVKQITANRTGLCTVINFPLGANSNQAVIAEAKAVLKEGIDELDMVQNLAALLSGQWEETYQGILQVRKASARCNVLLKVILETCYLSRRQIIMSCLIAKKAGADFVKTSTGMGSAGATDENVSLMRLVVGPKLGVKASGGIRTKADALTMLKAGANRIGTSNAKAIIEG